MKVNWFEKESTAHPFGNPDEREFTTAGEALAFVEELKARDDVTHVQYEVPPAERRAMPDGEVFGQGWIRDDAGGWVQQHRQRLGEPYESGPGA